MLKDTLSFIQSAENLAERFALETLIWQKQNRNNCVYLYGAGYLMQYYVRYLRKYGVEITAILDSHKEGNYGEIPIIRYDVFLQNMPDVEQCRFFVSAAKPYVEIIRLLRQRFPTESIIFVDWAFQIGMEDMSLSDYRSYLASNWKSLENLYESLTDEKSRVTLKNILREHISADPRLLLETLDPDLDYPIGVIQLGDNEVFVEPGANNGKTFLDFVRRCPQYKAAYLFEPEPCFQPVLQEIATKEANRGKTVYIIPKGVWDCETELQFASTEQGNGSFVMTPQTGKITSILTTTVDIEVMEPFTYLKMDIEGAEMKALYGAERHIRNYRPKLGISVYHKPTDLLEIWNYLQLLVPDYRFYLRNHTPLWDDIILYAI